MEIKKINRIFELFLGKESNPYQALIEEAIKETEPHIKHEYRKDIIIYYFVAAVAYRKYAESYDKSAVKFATALCREYEDFVRPYLLQEGRMEV